MGMDVYGINPVVVGVEPKFPENFDTLSDAAKEAYWEAVDEYQDANPGVYFRANVWSWRPLMEAMWESRACVHVDPHNWNQMSCNDGAGATTRQACDAMAKCLEEWSKNIEWDDNDCYVPASLINDCPVDKITGRFLSDNEARNNPNATSAYRVSRFHLNQWIDFLKNCGEGFKVW